MTAYSIVSSAQFLVVGAQRRSRSTTRAGGAAIVQYVALIDNKIASILLFAGVRLLDGKRNALEVSP